MPDKTVIMGSFREIEPTTDALDQIRALGIPDDDVTVLSSLPYSSKVLGRPGFKTLLPLISLGSAVVGLLFMRCSFSERNVVAAFPINWRLGGLPRRPKSLTTTWWRCPTPTRSSRWSWLPYRSKWSCAATLRG